MLSIAGLGCSGGSESATVPKLARYLNETSPIIQDANIAKSDLDSHLTTLQKTLRSDVLGVQRVAQSEEINEVLSASISSTDQAMLAWAQVTPPKEAREYHAVVAEMLRKRREALGRLEETLAAVRAPEADLDAAKAARGQFDEALGLLAESERLAPKANQMAQELVGAAGS